MTRLSGLLLFVLLSACRSGPPAVPDFKSDAPQTPQFFAPGVIATQYLEHSAPTLSSDGRAIYWSAFLNPTDSEGPPVILFIEKKGAGWSSPAVAPFSGQYRDNGPVFAPDDMRLYFYSDRPRSPGEAPGEYDIWYVERQGNGWGEPVNLGAPVNGPGFQGHVSFTRDYTLYFLGYAPGYHREMAVFRSERLSGGFSEPEVLPAEINLPECFKWCPFVSPDESFLLVSAYQEKGFGRGDICISHRLETGRWTPLVNLGETVNTAFNERFPAVSPDGRILFFCSDKSSIPRHFESAKGLDELRLLYESPGNGLTDVYWMSSDMLNDLKKTEGVSR